MKFRMGEIIGGKIWAIQYSENQKQFFKEFVSQVSTFLYQILYPF